MENIQDKLFSLWYVSYLVDLQWTLVNRLFLTLLDWLPTQVQIAVSLRNEMFDLLAMQKHHSNDCSGPKNMENHFKQFNWFWWGWLSCWPDVEHHQILPEWFFSSESVWKAVFHGGTVEKKPLCQCVSLYLCAFKLTSVFTGEWRGLMLSQLYGKLVCFTTFSVYLVLSSPLLSFQMYYLPDFFSSPEGLVVARFGWLMPCQLFSVCLAQALAPSARQGFCWHLLAACQETNHIIRPYLCILWNLLFEEVIFKWTLQSDLQKMSFGDAPHQDFE